MLNRSVGRVVASDVHPGMVRTDQQVLEINDLALPHLYRSLGEGRDRLGLEERRIEARRKLVTMATTTSEIRGLDPANGPCGPYPHPKRPGRGVRAQGSSVSDRGPGVLEDFSSATKSGPCSSNGEAMGMNTKTGRPRLERARGSALAEAGAQFDGPG